MTTPPQPAADYVIGHAGRELHRLDTQAEVLAPATRTLLTLAGIAPGMRVLDVGTGTGAVALLAAELVGPDGWVVGVDTSVTALEHARCKRDALGLTNVRFRPADLRTLVPAPGFDAVVGRLVLPVLPDPVAALRGWLRCLNPGGVVVAMESDMAAARTVPATPLATQVLQRIGATLDALNTPATFGPDLAALLTEAGAADPQILGVQAYLGADDARGPALLCDTVTTLLPAMEQTGVAAAGEMDVATLRHRLSSELRAYRAVLCPPPLVGAWAAAHHSPAGRSDHRAAADPVVQFGGLAGRRGA